VCDSYIAVGAETLPGDKGGRIDLMTVPAASQVLNPDTDPIAEPFVQYTRPWDTPYGTWSPAAVSISVTEPAPRPAGEPPIQQPHGEAIVSDRRV